MTALPLKNRLRPLTLSVWAAGHFWFCLTTMITSRSSDQWIFTGVFTLFHTCRVQMTAITTSGFDFIFQHTTSISTFCTILAISCIRIATSGFPILLPVGNPIWKCLSVFSIHKLFILCGHWSPLPLCQNSTTTSNESTEMCVLDLADFRLNLAFFCSSISARLYLQNGA